MPVDPSPSSDVGLSAARSLLVTDSAQGFEELVRGTQDGLFRGLVGLVANRADAEDLAQDTYVRAYRSLLAMSPATIESLRIRPWLWTIAVNTVRSDARRRSRRPRSVPMEPTHETSTGIDDPALVAIERFASVEWAKELATLGPAQREAVVLHHLVGLSYPEIAEVTGRPVNTLKSHTRRGLTALRSRLDAASGGTEP